MSIHVQLERFEGPLGLLLHLIREQEMDIFNINIHEITRQYLEYIKAMRRLDLEVAGEFVAMAATLLHIKSRMLLPQYNEEGEEVEVDPRKELVQKLVEYKRIRELSVDLYKRPLLGRDVFPRGERENIESIEESELVLEENPLFSLISAYRTAVKNMKKTVHRVSSELQSIAARILEIKDMLVMGRRVLFRDLITAKENVSSQVLVTFLSMLELAKMGFVSVFQTEPFADIHIESKQSIDNAAVSRVESYDSVNAAATANAIMESAQLTLDEPVDVLEGEDETVVAEQPVDAASDADIEEEERRLFAEANGEVYVPPAAVETAVVESDLTVAEAAPVADVASDEIALVADVVSDEVVHVGEMIATETVSLEMAATEVVDGLQDIDFEPSSHAHAEHVVTDEFTNEDVSEPSEDIQLTIGDIELSNVHAHADHNDLPPAEFVTTEGEVINREPTEEAETSLGAQLEALSFELAPPEVSPVEAPAPIQVDLAESEAEFSPGGPDSNDVTEPTEGQLETIELPPTSTPPEAASSDPEVPPPAAPRVKFDDLAFLTTPDPENVVKENINSAVNAAKSAFDAFNDDPEVK